MSTSGDLEDLLCARQGLRKHEKENRHWIYEIGRAIEEIQGGYPNSHTDTVRRFVAAWLAEGSAA